MTGPVDGESAIPPQMRAIYKQEYTEGVNLFQQSLQDYQGAESHKKALLKDVMNRALQVMNETARACLNKQAVAQNDKVAKDYQGYISNESPTGYNKLKTDIDDLKKFIG